MDEKSGRHLEPLLLLLYLVHHVSMAIMASVAGWDYRFSISILSLALLSLILYAIRPFSFRVRAGFYTVMVMSSLLIYCICNGHMNQILIPFLALSVILGLCGYASLMLIPVVFFMVMLAYNLFVAHSINTESFGGFVGAMLPTGNVLLTLMAITFWVVQRQKSQRHMMEVITKLEKAQKTKDDFLANVSHEIRTPINTIHGLGEMILEDKENEHVNENLLAIQAASNNLMNVVSDMLDFSELQAGQVAVVEEAYEVSDVVSEVLHRAMTDKSDKNLEIEMNLADDVPKMLIGDEKKIRRVVNNLISNSIKFTQDGKITVNFSSREESYGVNLIVSVSDNGIGMDQSEQEYIFKNFTQQNASQVKKESGMGLGLPISNALIRLMGGAMTINSTPGKGTTIQVVIPQKVAAGNETISKRSFVAPDAKVLVVDDNLMNIRVLEALLGKYKVQTAHALSGAEAVDKVLRHRYDFIFMDYMMPEMDGIECLHAIRKLGNEYCENVPIVALTANTVPGVREKMMSEGFAYFLAKPVELSGLEKLLKKLLPPTKIKEDDSLTDGQGTEATLKIGTLDAESGIAYCGGREAYISILQEYALRNEENWLPLQKLYDDKNWHDYIIMVHAVKSSMLSIGAKPLADMARALEKAGKEGNITYIEEHHDRMMKEYRRLIQEIADSSLIHVEASEVVAEESNENLRQITEAEFDAVCEQFQKAMYEFDEQGMKDALKPLDNTSFQGQALDSKLVLVLRKIDRADYFSAGETLIRIKGQRG